jgi:hypothetical protein
LTEAALASAPAAIAAGSRWRDFLELTKPKVSLLIVFTAVVGMVLASPGMVPLQALILGSLGIALASGSAAAFNHVIDRRIDGIMARTRRRPLPTGHLVQRQAVLFACLLGLASMGILWFGVNPLTAILSFASLIGYAAVYTLWLKRATPQNIVIGGAAGAAPPILGWVAVTNHVGAESLLLFLIIFTWTPPHFWALAIARALDTAALPRGHERLHLPGRGHSARRAVHVVCAGALQRAAARPAGTHVPVLDHLLDAAIRRLDRRSLFAVQVLTWRGRASYLLIGQLITWHNARLAPWRIACSPASCSSRSSVQMPARGRPRRRMRMRRKAGRSRRKSKPFSPTTG